MENEKIPEEEIENTGYSEEFEAKKFKKGESGNPSGRPKGSRNRPKPEDTTVYKPPFDVVAGKTSQEVLENNQTNIAYWLLLKAFEGNEKLQVILANKVFGSIGGIESEASKRLFKELVRTSKKDLERLVGEEALNVVSVDGEIVVKEEKVNPNRPKQTGEV